MSLQELLGIELPIIQAPMAGVQGSELAVAVSNAGGLGSLPCAMLDADTLHRELMVLHKQTDKPFNLNFFCHRPPAANPERDIAWRQLLSPYYEEYGIDGTAIPPDAGRRPFDGETAELVEEFSPPVVSFHFGLPAEALLARTKATGAKVLSSATTVEEARWLEERGVDAIIAQGSEAGGHRGLFLSDDSLSSPSLLRNVATQVGTFALVPQIVEAVEVPVIAAGGIADAKGIAAAMALGAVGVSLGTTFLLCPEAKTSQLHRAALKSEAARNTAITNIFTGRPARGIVNRAIRELGPMNSAVPEFPLATSSITPLRSRAEERGQSDFSPLWAGQNVSGAKEIPAAVLVQELAAAF